MIKKPGLICILICCLLIVGCGSQNLAQSNQQPEIREPRLNEPYKKRVEEHVSTNNCDGASPSTTVSRFVEQYRASSFEVQVGVGGLAEGAPIPGVLSAELEAKIQAAIDQTFGNRYGQGKEIILQADPGSNRMHTVVWEEVRVTGIIDVVYPEGIGKVGFDKVIGVDIVDRTSKLIDCDDTQPLPSASDTNSESSNSSSSTITTNPQPSESSSTENVFPERFLSDTGIPNATSFVLQVEPGTIHTWTSGPVCVSDVCLPGGEQRGSVVIMLPKNDAYILTDLVPGHNWHGAYYGEANQWEILAEVIVNTMKKPGNCGTSPCNIIDVLVVGPNGVVTQFVK